MFIYFIIRNEQYNRECTYVSGGTYISICFIVLLVCLSPWDSLYLAMQMVHSHETQLHLLLLDRLTKNRHLDIYSIPYLKTEECFSSSIFLVEQKSVQYFPEFICLFSELLQEDSNLSWVASAFNHYATACHPQQRLYSHTSLVPTFVVNCYQV